MFRKAELVLNRTVLASMGLHLLVAPAREIPALVQEHVKIITLPHFQPYAGNEV
jgi:hypothetical protein